MVWSGGNAPFDIPDFRDAATVQSDSAAVRRQLGQLADTSASVMPWRLHTPPMALTVAGQQVLVAPDQLVVGRSGSTDFRLTAVSSGYDEAGLLAEMRRLNASGFAANPNVIARLDAMPANPALPFPTTGRGPFDARAAGHLNPTVRVAIIDTGLARTPRLDGWLSGVRAYEIDELDVVPPSGRLDWGAGHGTFVAGIVRQVAPSCEIVVYRFTGPDGIGTEADAAEAILRAARDAGPARLIICAGFSVPAVGGTPPVALAAAVRRLQERRDTLVVASAGNEGTSEAVYPAAFDGVVGVGALHADLTGASFSGHGNWVTCSAVGVGVVSTFVPGVLPPEPDPAVPEVTFGPDAWAVWSGNSFTTPQIAAAVAVECQQQPGVVPREALQHLLERLSQLQGFGKVARILPGTPLRHS